MSVNGRGDIDLLKEYIKKITVWENQARLGEVRHL